MKYSFVFKAFGDAIRITNDNPATCTPLLTENLTDDEVTCNLTIDLNKCYSTKVQTLGVQVQIN